MKKLLLLLPIAFVFACGNAEQTSNTEVQTQNNEADHAGHDHAHTDPNAVVSYKTHDPVCKMDRDEKWSITSVYQNDTVKFCSPVCKDRFDKEPSKYVATAQ